LNPYPSRMSSRLRRPGALHLAVALAALLLTAFVHGQEPSAALKQADADYRQGVAALNRGDLKAAKSLFEAVVRLAPAAEQGHSALGAVLVRQGQTDDGIKELQKALAMKPSDGSAQENLAMAYAQTGAPGKALPLFSKLETAAGAEKRALTPDVLEAYARALAATGNSAAALVRLNLAVAQEPRNAAWRNELGTLYAMGGDWERAEPEFREAVRLDPQLALAHLHLGSVLQAEHKPGAAQEWGEAVGLAPKNPQIALIAGRGLAEAGADDLALPVLERAHELAPGSTEAAYELALVLQRASRMEASIPLLKTVVAAEPKNGDALINLGLALTQTQHAKDAVPLLQRAVALKPEDGTAHQNLAAAYVQLNQLDDAVVELKAALKISPDAPQLHYNLGLAYKMQDDAAAAIPELETAQKLNPQAWEPAYVLGLEYMQVARYDEAAPQLETALKLHPDNGEGWATLGSVYNKMNKLPEAVAALREAIRQLPDNSDPHLTLAAVLVKQSQPEEAAAERKKAAELMRAHMNLQRAEVATGSGKSLLLAGKLDDAIVEFRAALGFDPNYAAAHLGLAEALEKEGKTAEAQAELELAKTAAKSPQ